MKPIDRISTTINRLGHQGDGVADGPVFARRCLPGETVSGVLNGQTLSDIRIETPSPDRIQAACRHYKACGGCSLQHAAPEFVAAWKQELVQNALHAQGLETTFRPVHTSAEKSRRRATFAARRTKKGALVGFHGAASDVITEIPDCILLDPALIAALPVAEELAVIGASRKTPLSVTATVSEIGLDILVRHGKPLDSDLRFGLAQLIGKHNLARLAWEDELIGMNQPPMQRFGRAKVCPPPGSFLQATKDGETALRDAVLEITDGARKVMDLFAGCGTFTLPLAERADVHAVEGERAMIAALDAGWRKAQGLHTVTSEARDLFRRPMLPDELNPFGAPYEAVVIDPPRAGAQAQVEELARGQVPTIAYVSCNPVTFARDARILVEAGYRLNWIQVVDQFRWAAHAELAASFTLEN